MAHPSTSVCSVLFKEEGGAFHLQATGRYTECIMLGLRLLSSPLLAIGWLFLHQHGFTSAMLLLCMSVVLETSSNAAVTWRNIYLLSQAVACFDLHFHNLLQVSSQLVL